MFRVAEEKNWRLSVLAKTDDTYEVWVSSAIKIPNIITYNPTLPLLEQSEETLQQLISLFE